MKRILLFTLTLIITLGCFSQNKKPKVKIPKGWTYCPQGSYKKLKEEIWAIREYKYSVSPFIISNEITNKEYWEFYNTIKLNPNDTLQWVEIVNDDNGSSVLIKMAIHKDIFANLIDQSVWDQDSTLKEYFLNPKFNNYPVIGVTYQGAKYYCIWKTLNENTILEKKGKALIPDYRIPTEREWEYAASFKEDFSELYIEELHNVKLGESNKLYIQNLASNVAEWIMSVDTNSDTLGVVRGGSYKTKNNTELRELVPKKKSKDYIGFRIVRSCLDD